MPQLPDNNEAVLLRLQSLEKTLEKTATGLRERENDAHRVQGAMRTVKVIAGILVIAITALGFYLRYETHVQNKMLHKAEQAASPAQTARIQKLEQELLLRKLTATHKH